VLVTESDYVALTGDEDTATVLVTAALEEAQRYIEEELQRPLEFGLRIEDLKVYPNGRVYPSATPLVATPSDAMYGIIDESSIYYGWGRDPIINWGGLEWGADLFSSGWAPGQTMPVVEITYQGGFTDENLPVVLKRAIIRLAGALLKERSAKGRRIQANIPAGATNVSVGDVSVSLAIPDAGVSALVPGLSQSIRKYKRREL
jgi:hypothetical protein